MQQSGGIEKEKSPLAMMASVVFANGAYQASKNGVKTYGSTKEQALEKLAELMPEDQTELDTSFGLPGHPVDPVAPGGIAPINEESLENLEPENADAESQAIKEIMQDPEGGLLPEPKTTEDVDRSIQDTWSELTPEEYSGLEELEEAAGAGPDPKTDLQ